MRIFLNKMKEITIDGITLMYQGYTEYDYNGELNYTEFYRGYRKFTRKKWWIFGSVIEGECPNHVFTIYEDFNNPNLSKEWWREKIREKIEIMKRADEIKKRRINLED
jgi:hypothetical protein